MKKKTIKKTTLRNTADRLMSKFIRARGRCQLAGLDFVRCGGALQDMHILTRGITAIRYEVYNHLCGCAGHHVYYTYHPYEWEALVEKHFPKQWKLVTAHKNDTIKKSEELYTNVIKALKESVL